MFKKGQSGNPKGAPKGNHGAGRDQDWLKAQCRKIVERDKLIEFLGQVARGENVDSTITLKGEVIQIPANIKNRLQATDMLLDRGYGKPQQEISGTLGITDLLNSARKKYEN